MLRKFMRSRKFKSVTPDLYRDIVAQSRQPRFYTDYNVEDNFDGRFNVLSIHMILVLERLKSEGEDGETLSQELVDHFFDDMDGVVREMGTGDMGVSHKIKKLANRFYGRMKVFREGLGQKDDVLKEAVWRNIYPEKVEDGAGDAAKMADYMRRTASELEKVSFAVFSGGKPVFS